VAPAERKGQGVRTDRRAWHKNRTTFLTGDDTGTTTGEDEGEGESAAAAAAAADDAAVDDGRLIVPITYRIVRALADCVQWAGVRSTAASSRMEVGRTRTCSIAELSAVESMLADCC
jgi:hypothetical protein